MKPQSRAAAIGLIVFAYACFGESPLDKPGFKDATVRSEIKRGFDVVYTSAYDHLGRNLTVMANQMRELSGSNTASTGYILGARLAELFVLDFLLRSSEVSTSNSAQEITDASTLGSSLRREIRRRTESLSVSEEQMFEAVQKDFHGLLNRYDSGADVSIAKGESTGESNAERHPLADKTPLPEFSPLPTPEFVRLTKEFTLVSAKGREGKTLERGKRLRVVRRDQDGIAIDYFGEEFLIPTAITEPSK